MELKSLSRFKNKGVELYRSSDPKETGLYFDGTKKPAYFEILRFEYKQGCNEFYVRYPNGNHFIEIKRKGSMSQGYMEKITCINPWENKYKDILEINVHLDNMLLSIGSKFNFLKRVAVNSEDKKFNIDELDIILDMYYLELPDTREVAYFYKTNEDNPIYILIDFPSFNFCYEQHRLFIIQNNKHRQFEINEFVRYRDGGSTYITFNLEGEKQKLSFPINDVPKWNENILLDVSQDEKQKIIKLI